MDHSLNRGHAWSTLFHKPEDDDALERILVEGRERDACRMRAYQFMPNHWLFVLQPTENGGMSNFLRWVSLTHTMRLHAQYGTGGQGDVYQGRLKRFPVQDDEPFLLVCRYVERNALRAGLVRRAEDGTWGSRNRWREEPERKPRQRTAMGRAGQQAADRRGTQGHSHQRQPGLSLGRWEWGAGNLAAPEPPVDPPPTRKTQKRVLTPFLP
jgi:REP element-mobilizing transposase RayT